MWIRLLVLTGATYAAAHSGCDGTWINMNLATVLDEKISVLRCDWAASCQTSFSYDLDHRNEHDQINIVTADGPTCDNLNSAMERTLFFKAFSRGDMANRTAHDVTIATQRSSSFCIAFECDNMSRPCSAIKARAKMRCAAPLEADE
jgi:hypothetical protein